jgi:hypothetical protein
MKHGTKKIVALLIISIDARLNRNGLCTVQCEPSEFNEKGIFQMTDKYLDNLAYKAGAINGDILQNAVAGSLDENYLNIEFMYVEEGQLIGNDAEGNPILSKDGNDKFTVTHWRTEQFESIELGEDANQYAKDLNKQLDLEDARASRNAKREEKTKRTAPRVKTNVPKLDDGKGDNDKEGDDDDEEEGAEELFSAPKTEAKPKKK